MTQPPVQLAASGNATLYPSSNTASGGGGFTNPSGTYAVGGGVATAAPASSGTISTNFASFNAASAIPTSATITGITLRVNYKVDTTASIATMQMSVTAGGVGSCSTSDTTEPTTYTDKTLSLSGCSRSTRAFIVDEPFLLTVNATRGSSGTAVNFSFDYVRLEVSYTTPALTQDSYRAFQNPNTDGNHFGTFGRVSTTAMNEVNDLITDGTYLYLAGQDPPGRRVLQKRDLATGAVVSGFTPDSLVVADDYNGGGIRTDGTYLYVWGQESSAAKLRLEKRLLSTGLLVSGFGTGGYIRTGGAGASAMSNSITVNGGWIYVAQFTSSNNWVVEKRSSSTGALDTGFGSSGTVTVSGSNYGGPLLTTDATYLYISGTDSSGKVRIEKRLLTTGVADASFGTSGVITGSTMSAASIIVAGGDLYVGGFGTSAVKVERRLSSTGALVSGFGSSGLLTGTSGTAGLSLASDGTSLFVSGGLSSDSSGAGPSGSDPANSGGRAFVEKRTLASGVLDSPFVTNGRATPWSRDDWGGWAGTTSGSAFYLAADAFDKDGNATANQVGSIQRLDLANGKPYVANQDLTALATTNSAATTPVGTFRLRMGLGTATGALPVNASYRLQVAPRVGAACGGGDEVFADVTSGSGSIRFRDNSNVDDGIGFAADSVDDPLPSAGVNVPETYVESNPAKVIMPVASGNSAIWDFSLEAVSGAAGTRQCFMLVDSIGTALDAYSNYAEVLVPAPNTAPGSPASLAQVRELDGSALSAGAWINASQGAGGSKGVTFSATVTDTDVGDTSALCVEVKPAAGTFDGTGALCGTALSSGTNVATSVSARGWADGTYKWRVQAKDAAGVFSAWVVGSTFGIDTIAPVAGTTYDGPTNGSDAAYNNGSLSSLSLNWTGFSDATSGLSYYQALLGTSPGIGDLASANVGNVTTATASSLNLRTGVTYYGAVFAVDNAGNGSVSVATNGQQVLPTIAFTVGASSLAFNTFPTSTASLALTTQTNAYGGYNVTLQMPNLLTAGSKTIPAFSAPWTAPTVWSGTGLGFTSDDVSVTGSSGFAGAKYAGLPAGTTARVPDHASGVVGTALNETFNATFRMTVDGTQAAGAYAGTLVVTCNPSF